MTVWPDEAGARAQRRPGLDGYARCRFGRPARCVVGRVPIDPDAWKGWHGPERICWREAIGDSAWEIAMRVVQMRPHTDDVCDHTTAAEVDRLKSAYAKYADRDRGNPEKEKRPGRLRMVRDRDVALYRLLDRETTPPLKRYRVLDLGCGTGDLIHQLQRYGFPNDRLFGVDLLPESLATAKRKCPDVSFTEANAEHVPFPDQRFDFILVFTVFSSILSPGMASNVAREITRVLTPDGVIIWYDLRYPNPWNRNVRAMTRRRIQDLFPDFEIELTSKTLLPPIAYRLGTLTDPLYPTLALVPAFRSHYFGMLRSASSGVIESGSTEPSPSRENRKPPFGPMP
ncbi:class I SAM-dependent methyltransferase [Bosea sp. 2YAB26]|uniref:class I SAM-dependent methyltransferase n=1 Tax=Bosea sp. 2YAB26 TaxID=3237478 RepID=UPI003F9336DF